MNAACRTFDLVPRLPAENPLARGGQELLFATSETAGWTTKDKLHIILGPSES